MQKSFFLFLALLAFLPTAGCGMYARTYPITEYSPEKPNYNTDSLAMAYMKAAGITGEVEDVEIDPSEAVKVRKSLPVADSSDYLFTLAVNNTKYLGNGTPLPGASMDASNAFFLVGAILANSDSTDKRREMMNTLSLAYSMGRFGIWLPADEFSSPTEARDWVTREMLNFVKQTPFNNKDLIYFHLNKHPDCPPFVCVPGIDYFEIYSLQPIPPQEQYPPAYYDNRPNEQKLRRGNLSIGIAKKTRVTPFINESNKEYFFVAGKIGVRPMVHGKPEATESPSLATDWNIQLSNHFSGKNLYMGQILPNPVPNAKSGIPVVLNDGKINFFISPQS